MDSGTIPMDEEDAFLAMSSTQLTSSNNEKPTLHFDKDYEAGN